MPAGWTPRSPRGARLAVADFEALGCEGSARVDVFLTRDRKVIIDEINTMPGFTATWMFPTVCGPPAATTKLARLLQLALHRPVGRR